MGYAYLLTIHRKFTEAMEKIEEAMRAVEDVPPIIELAKGIILYQAGRYRDALRSLLEFAETHENSDPAFYWMACCHDQLGQYEDTIANAQKAYQLSYGNPLNLMVEARAHALLGDQNKVCALAESLTVIEKERYVSAFHKAVIEVAHGNHDQAFELLDRGYEERDFWMVTSATDGRLRDLHPDPRFGKLLDRLGLPRPE